MPEQKGYNGWANYETWCVALWIDNDEGLQDHVFEMAREHGKDLHTLEDCIKDMVEELVPDLGATMFADLLNAALSDVNWREIAEAQAEAAAGT